MYSRYGTTLQHNPVAGQASTGQCEVAAAAVVPLLYRVLAISAGARLAWISVLQASVGTVG